MTKDEIRSALVLLLAAGWLETNSVKVYYHNESYALSIRSRDHSIIARNYDDIVTMTNQNVGT